MCLPHSGGDSQCPRPALQQLVHPVSENSGESDMIKDEHFWLIRLGEGRNNIRYYYVSVSLRLVALLDLNLALLHHINGMPRLEFFLRT